MLSLEDQKLITTFLDTVKKNGTICKQEVLSLEENVPEIVSDTLNINNFTSLPSSTCLIALVSSVESFLLTSDKEEAKTIEVVLKQLTETKRHLSRVHNLLSRPIGLNNDLIHNILNNHYLSKTVDGTDDKIELIDYIDLPINEVIDDFDNVITLLNIDSSKHKENMLENEVLKIRTHIDNSPTTLFTLLRYANNNEISFNKHTNKIGDVTLRDIILKFIVNEEMVIGVEKLIKEIKEVHNALMFDKRYDGSMSINDFSYTYDSLYNRLVNIETLFKDDVSIAMILILKVALTVNK